MKAEIKIIFNKEEVITLIQERLRGVETYGPGEFSISGRWTSMPSEFVAEFIPALEPEEVKAVTDFEEALQCGRYDPLAKKLTAHLDEASHPSPSVMADAGLDDLEAKQYVPPTREADKGDFLPQEQIKEDYPF